ncbi:MAG: polymer-forming cytoskeletal protein [Neisseriaceae bacterium]|nr:polymer-forming cytoskeletal protein [Neisseriaceae bacterium]
MFKKNDTSYSSSSSNALNTIIGEQCVILGNIESTQSVKIDGRVEGDVEVDGLTVIGENATIIGNVNCQEVVAYGQISGNVRCDSLHLKSTARIVGEIVTNNLQIEAGAMYQGNISMNGNQSLNINNTASYALPEK